MMSFLLKELLLAGGLSEDDIKNCYLLIQLYFNNIIEKFPELASKQYQNHLKISALFLAASELISKLEKSPLLDVLDGLLKGLKTDSKSLSALMSDPLNPNLNYLKHLLSHQTMKEPNNLSFGFLCSHQ